MNQMARGLEDTVGTEALRQLERLKWFLWDGNVLRALQVVGDLEIDLDVDVDNLGPSRPAQAGEDDDRVRPLHRGQRRVDPELRGALPLWRGDLERLRRVGGQSGREQAHGEEAADALVARGAHLLLQIRTRALNDDLAGDFRRWYPAFMPTSEPRDLAA